MASEDDWRRFLDLVEERGGATSGLDLFTDYVVRTDDQDLLSERQNARDAYAALENERADWESVPDTADRFADSPIYGSPTPVTAKMGASLDDATPEIPQARIPD